MTPHKLTIQGLYSYIHKQVIDFDNLTRDGLFGIFGSVGSGKSSVLEAISYALYGNTERLNSRDNRSYNMMNLRSDKLFIEFEFSNGEQRRFMCRIEGKRNSKQFEVVGKLDRSFYELAENGKWMPIDTPIEEITGLSYDNFRRTVIIPQGKFQEFLQLGPKERTAMMQELFHLHRYDLYSGVADLHNKSLAVLQDLQGQLKTLGEINPDQIEQLTVQLELIKHELGKKEAEYKSVQEKIEISKRVKELILKLEKNTKQLSFLLEKEEGVNRQQKELDQYERCVRLFKSLLDASHRLQTDVEINEKSLRMSYSDQLKLRKTFDDASQQFQKTTFEFEKGDSIKREAEELVKLSEVHKLKQEVAELKGRQEAGVQMLKDKLAAQKEIREKISTETAHLKTKKEQLPDYAKLMEIKEWYRANNQLTKDFANVEKELVQQNQQFKDIEVRFQELFKGLGLSMKTDVTLLDLCQILRCELEKQQGILEEQQKASEQLSVRLKVQSEIQGFADGLHEGEPCPLCGSDHHPNLLKVENVRQELVVHEKSTAEIRHKQQVILKQEKELVQIQAEVELFEKERVREREKLESLKKDLQVHLNSFKWEGFEPNASEKLTQEVQKHKDLTDEIKKLEKTLEELRKNLETGDVDMKKWEDGLNKISHELAAKTSRIETVFAAITRILVSDFENFSADDLKSMASELIKKAESVETQYKKEEEQIKVLSRALDKLAGQISELEKNGEKLKISLKNNETAIESLLKEQGGVSREQVVLILAAEPDVDKIRKEIEQFRNDLATKRSELKQLESDLDGKQFDPDVYEGLIKKGEVLTGCIKNLNSEAGQLIEKNNRLKSDYEKYKDLKKKLEEAEIRTSDLNDMRNLFKGSGFVNYISTVYLQELCKSANNRFYRLTRQQLSLELGDDNMFYVRDFLNEGRIRSVKTLSGGQTFQAALSLALALADSIQKHTSEHGNFFFLDEGFGTLDKDSLRIVFDTLKSLRHENRIVGVISHVEEMQQEITTFLKVVNDEKTGSCVTASWNMV